MPKFVLPLTEAKIKNAKPADKSYKLSDSGGLYLEVTPVGSELWRLGYTQPNGKKNRLALGAYPVVALASARDKRLKIKQQIDAGTDPAQARRAAKQQRIITASNTFEVIACEWHANKKESLFENEVWIIKWDRMKMGKRKINPRKVDHHGHLPRQGWELLRELHTLTGGNRYLFPNRNDHSRPTSNWAILAALKRMGCGGRMTGHGFRIDVEDASALSMRVSGPYPTPTIPRTRFKKPDDVQKTRIAPSENAGFLLSL